MNSVISKLSYFFLQKFLDTENDGEIDTSKTKSPGNDEFKQEVDLPSFLETRPDQNLKRLSHGKSLMEVSTCAEINLNLSTSSIFFGQVEAGKNKVKYLTVTNHGSCKIDFSFLNPNGFTVFPSFGTIEPGSSQSFNITFQPLSTQIYETQYYQGFLSFPGGSSVNLKGTGVKKET